MSDTRRERIAELMAGDEAVDPATVEAALRRLHDEGLDSLDALVRRMLARQQLGELARGGDTLVAALAQSRDAPPVPREQIRHRAPTCRLVVDGVEWDPSDISRWDGTALNMVAGPSPDTLYAFSDDAPLQALTGLYYSHVLGWPDPYGGGGGGGVPGQMGPGWPPQGCGFAGAYPCYPPPAGGGGGGGNRGGAYQPPQPLFTSGTVQIFSDVDYKGDWFWVEEGRVYRDLRAVPRNTDLFWSDDWNDVISSMSTTNDHMLYSEHIQMTGNTLYVMPRTAKTELVSIGWNDRISSVWNYGPRA